MPDAYRMLFAGSANPVIDEKEKAKRRRGWDHSTWVMRDVGEFTTDNYLSYPTFNKDYHRADYGEQDSRDDKLAQYLRENNYIPGRDWCSYLILDPGTQRPALLWVAIPPEEFWYKGNPFHVVYREFTGRENADQLAKRVAMCDPRRTYHRFIMDCKAGDQTPMGYAASVMANYSRAWINEGLRSTETGSSFQRGETSWVVRSTELRKLLEPVHPEANMPALRIVNHMCPQLIHQIMHNRRHVQKHDIQDKQASGQVKDLLDTLEYYAAASPVYAHPPNWQPPENEAIRHFNKADDMWSQLVTRPQAPRGNVICGAP